MNLLVLISFANVTGKHLCWSLFLMKLQTSRPETLLKRAPFKRDYDTVVFFCEICEIFKTPILKDTCEWLPLYFKCTTAYQ